MECFFKQAHRLLILLGASRSWHFQLRLESIPHRFIHRLIFHSFAKSLLEPLLNLAIAVESFWLLQSLLKLCQHFPFNFTGFQDILGERL